MPPSRHSSSSHFSSPSRSSFGGSSHGSFGSSSRSGFSSGPSRHSSSSGFSKPIFGNRPSSSGNSSMSGNRPGMQNRPSYFQRQESEMRFPAPPRSTYNYSNRIFYGNRHQYRYYPTAFILNGINYGAGYYDEDGTYYKNLEMEDEQGNTVKYLTCEYCGCQAEYKPEDGAIPNCTHCGAPLKIDNIQKDSAYKQSDASYTGETGKKRNWKKIILWIVVFNVAINVLLSFMRSNTYNDNYGGSYSNSYSYSQSSQLYSGETLYLKKEGNAYVYSDKSDYDKKLTWDSSVDSYYDRDTKCWLWYNRDVSPARWQYWYEGISSDYGDYGWMEYESGEWRIEVNDSNWKTYTGNTSQLWHIE